MFMSLKCVSAKSGTCTLIASRTHASVVQDTQAAAAAAAAAALFDVCSCFEALSERT